MSGLNLSRLLLHNLRIFPVRWVKVRGGFRSQRWFYLGCWKYCWGEGRWFGNWGDLSIPLTLGTFAGMYTYGSQK
jgi:hypothetical protein